MSDESGAMTMMPKYRCHKKVWALQIKSIAEITDGLMLSFEEPHFAPRQFNTDELKGRPTPQPGWYFVQYEDGYISFSPPEVFEEGYTLIVSNLRVGQAVNFSQSYGNSQLSAPAHIQSWEELNDLVFYRLEEFPGGLFLASSLVPA